MTRFSLLVEKGKLDAHSFEVTRESTTLGSASLNDICLPDDPSVARVHAEIRRNAAGLMTIAPVGQEAVHVNGKAITTATTLKVGDRVAIGRSYVFRVSDSDGLAPAAGDAGAAAATKLATPGRAKLPTWVVLYLIGMALAAGYLAFNRSSAVASLESVRADEARFAAERKLPQQDTDRVLRLLTLGQIYERQGKQQTAYEVYRDLLGARTPPQPQSPAYRFATGRMVAVGGARR